MALSRRGAAVVAFTGFLVLFLGTPVAAIYAFDYHLVNAAVAVDAPPVAYESLSAAGQRAVDRAIEGDGPWYRTPADAPLPRNPIAVQRGDWTYTLALRSQFHWGSWRGKLPVLTAVGGLALTLIGLRKRPRSPAPLEGSDRRF